MTLFFCAILFYLQILVQSRIIPINSILAKTQVSEENLETEDDISSDEEIFEVKNNKDEGNLMHSNKYISTQKPCSIVVLSNAQNLNLQSLLRKYRYDAQGLLIPGSVKYYLKLPQLSGHHPAESLMPLADKTFSSSGGYVRYYKEVPAIPQTW